MAELIDIILKKNNWANKLDDPAIVETWRTEAAAQNINANVFECALQLLKEYVEKSHGDYIDFEERFHWPVRLGVEPSSDAGITCTCPCACCQDGYNRESDEDDDVSSEDDDEDDGDKEGAGKKRKAAEPNAANDWQREWKLRRKVKCQCTKESRIAKYQAFVDKFVASTTLNDADFKTNLIEQIAQLESTFTAVDYHPGSNNQVIDLVHPSLYCYVKGVSQPVATAAGPAPTTNAVFQWLPAEFNVARDADNNVDVSINSYINNLPREANEALYTSIAQVFGKMVPHFDALLQKLSISNRLPAPAALANAPLELANCQVIVKLANIVIAPGENSFFPGGHWHLEGMATERIVATGIYYYDMTNVEANTLEFRSTIEDYIDYPQSGYEYVKLHYGMGPKDDDNTYETTVELGDVETREDMLLVFPNFLQHKVSEVRLKDKTKPGTRKILCFFLISPYEQVVSTAHVAPQQQSLGGTMSLEEAQLYRELLMFQRKYELTEQTAFFERGWSLCEH